MQMLKRVTDRDQLIETHGKDGGLADAELRFMDLSGLDLSGLDLSHANLSGSRAHGTRFNDCNMTSLFVQDAILTDIQVKGSELHSAFFQRVNLTGATLEGCNLTECNMLLCPMERIVLKRCNLSGGQLLGCNMDGGLVENSVLTDVALRESTVSDLRFTLSDISGVDLRKVNLHDATYDKVLAKGAIYYGRSPWDGQAVEGVNWRRELPTFDGE